MNICVTGGAGFIGSHLVDRLIELGHKVLIIDNLSTGCKEFINSKAKFIESDIRDNNLVSIFKSFKPDYVYHEAAQTMVPTSMEDPAYDCDVNLMGLINVLNASLVVGVKKVLMPSSAAVYGDLSVLPLKEEQNGSPSSFYGLTKLTSEYYLDLYYKNFGLPYICYRYSNVYGPRQGNGGEGGVISIFVQKLVNEETITIYGDGEQTRDFIYVSDVVDANILGIEKEHVVGVFNVSTGKETSINELVGTLNTISDNTLQVNYGDTRIGDIEKSCLCTKKAEKEFKFKASIKLKEGLEKTLRYFTTSEF